jgi:hypothetical protein
MTAPARLTQADMERAAKAVANAGVSVGRIIMDFANQRIEVIVGEPGTLPAEPEKWTDDDV